MLEHGVFEPDMENMSPADERLSVEHEHANFEAGIANGLIESPGVAELQPAGDLLVEANLVGEPTSSETAADSSEPTVVDGEVEPDSETQQDVSDEGVAESLAPDQAYRETDSPPASPCAEEPAPPQAVRTEEQQQAKPVSTAKLIANRLNAAHSTGPKTERGKSFSRCNAIKHGLLAKPELLEAGDRERLTQLQDDLVGYWNPCGGMEEMIVSEMAICCWRLERGALCEHAAALLETADRMPEKATSERQRELIKLQLAVPFGETLDRLLRYSAAAQRQLLAYIKVLLELQKARKKEQGS